MEFLQPIINLFAAGFGLGFLPGMLSGGITLSITRQPDSLFKVAMGILVGAAGVGIFMAGRISSVANSLMANAGSASVPDSVGADIIEIMILMGAGGLVGGLLFQLISSIGTTILGAILGGLAGMFIGVIVILSESYNPLPIGEIFFTPIIAFLVMILFAVFGSTTSSRV